ncbi:MAG: hypothetical protein NT018_02615 [Armatimonadetes bacterium]|nr:hypothetical protein [Armatimonadota bacterium]
MLANVICVAFLSLASLLIFLKKEDRTGRSSFFVFTVGFALMAIGFATKGMSITPGLTLIVIGFGWILLDAYGCLEWTKRRR